MWVQTPTLDGCHDVRSTTAAGTGAEEGHPLVLVLYRPHQSIRLRRPNPLVGCPSSVWRATENARCHPPISRRYASMRAAGRWKGGGGEGRHAQETEVWVWSSSP